MDISSSVYIRYYLCLGQFVLFFFPGGLYIPAVQGTLIGEGRAGSLLWCCKHITFCLCQKEWKISGSAFILKQLQVWCGCFEVVFQMWEKRQDPRSWYSQESHWLSSCSIICNIFFICRYNVDTKSSNFSKHVSWFLLSPVSWVGPELDLILLI